MPHGMKFNIINFVDVEYSRRVNPIQLKYINNLAAASETAETLLESLQKARRKAAVAATSSSRPLPSTFLAACIYFFCNYGKEPYDKDGKMLIAERREDPKTKRLIPTGRVFDHSGAEVQPAYWLGKYSDMPHILSFLNESYQTIFEVLQTDNEVALAWPVPDCLCQQSHGAVGRYDWHATCLYLPSRHQGILLDIPQGRR